jgi:putative ABC transport system permease protein
MGGVRGSRLRQILVMGQLALACLLVIEIAVLVRAAWHLGTIEKGFDPSHVLTVRVDLPETRYVEPRRIRDFLDTLVGRIDGLPGVVSVAAIDRLPIADREVQLPFIRDDQPGGGAEALPRAARAVITPAYFRTLQIPLLRGRAFSDGDSANARPVAIISVEMARRHWPAGDAIGRRLRFESTPPGPWLEIVGIAGDVRNSDADAGVLPQVYLPAGQFPERSLAIVLRTEGARPAGLTSAIRMEVTRLDTELPIFGVATMDEVLFADLGTTYLLVSLLAAVAFVALALAAGGLYGLVAYTVSQRTREIGIRVALGAEPRRVVRMMLRHAAPALAVGGLMGVGGGFVLVTLTSSALAEVDPGNPLAHGAVLALLAGVLLAASYVPARRALRVDPLVALRSE